MAGIIPAGAGLTGISKLPMWQIRDHPRGCGAHRRLSNVRSRMPGSSPRVRGSQAEVRHAELGRRIIPAGAGLTQCRRLQRSTGWDHPRGCGAHSVVPMMARSTPGSSPRVRGSLDGIALLVYLEGIIPAGAGLTGSIRQGWRSAGDHPRGCGAHFAQQTDSVKPLGSSPRVRGSLLPESGVGVDHGIIPAGAGLTHPLPP